MNITNKLQTAMYMGQEPLWWNDLDLTPENTEAKIRQAYNFYNYMYDHKQLKAFIVEYMTTNEYPKIEIEAIKNLKDCFIVTPVGYLVRMLNEGCDKLSNDRIDYVKQGIADMIAKSYEKSEDDEPSVISPATSKELRIICDAKANIDDFLDKFDFRVGVDVTPWFSDNRIDGKTATQLVAYIQPQLNEALEALESEDDQLKDAYRLYTKKQLRSWIALLESIVEKANILARLNVKTTQRKPRMKKPRSVTKQIAKLQVQQKEDKYSLKSIDPAKVIGATSLWVFNTKYRTLGCYIAEPGKTFEIKGTTLQNYDKTKSFKKKVRSPKTLFGKDFFSTEKRMQKIFGGIKAKDRALNGRINKETILLKAF